MYMDVCVYTKMFIFPVEVHKKLSSTPRMLMLAAI